MLRDINLISIMEMLQLMDRVIALRESDPLQTATQVVLPKPRLFMLQGHRIKGATGTAQRFPFNAKILIHKNDRYIKGAAENISSSGMFVRAGLKVFEENEIVRLSITPMGSKKTYRAIAHIVRFSKDPRFNDGYGLKFVMGT